MDVGFIQGALRRNHLSADGWIYLTEVRTRIGFSFQRERDLASTRVIDAFAIHTWPSRRFCRVAYEIKTHRSDWLSEIRDCRKRTQAFYLSNRFYFAVSEGVVNLKKDRLGCLDGCGVIQVAADGSMEVLQIASHREAWPMPDDFIVSLLRRATQSSINRDEELLRTPPLFEPETVSAESTAVVEI